MKPFTGTAVREARKLIGTFIYFFILIGLFVVFRSVILNEPNLLYHHGFTIINAWLLAKLTVIADYFWIRDNFKSRPLIYPILLKSTVLSVLLIG